MTQIEQILAEIDRRIDALKEVNSPREIAVREELKDLRSYISKQVLANSAKTCKDEPKFKVGDKIKYAGGPDHCAEKIIAIRNDAYYFSEVVSLPFIEQDKWELVGQNPAWSEKNEAVLDALIRRLEGEDIYVSPHLAVECLKSLKSLKSRYTWKPSDEQMTMLHRAVVAIAPGVLHAGIESLYNDLKELKG